MLFERVIKRIQCLMGSNKVNNAKIAISRVELIESIKKFTLFSLLTKSECNDFLDLTEEVTLKKGDILFQKGDISDSMYIVVKGQLIASTDVNIESRNIGKIYGGETIGELGVFSKKPRSLTVAALYDSTLLKLSRASLIEFCKKNPSAEFHTQMLDKIIQRSQSIIKLISEEKLLKHGVIVSATNESIPAYFIEKLKENLGHRYNLIFVDEAFLFENNITDKDMINQLINMYNDKNVRLIFIIKHPEMYKKYLGSDDMQESKGILDNIDAIYLFALANTKPAIRPSIKNILDSRLFPFVTKKELILFHPESESNNLEYSSEWIEMYPFTLHHHIRLKVNKDFQRFIRFLVDMPIGLVFSGGGIKACAGLGVIKALEEENIPIDAIGGTSAGALIASVYALHQNFENSYDALYKFFNVGSNTFKIYNLTFPIISINNGRILNEPLISLFSNAKAENLSLSNFSIATNMSTRKEVLQDHGLIWENLRSSMSLPLVYPPVIKDGHMFVDGGLLNNFPIDRMRKLIGNNAFIIGVLLSEINTEEGVYNFPTVVPFFTALMARLNIAYKEYKYPPLFQTFINSLLIGATAKTQLNTKETNLLIQPDLREIPILSLKPDKVIELINYGYLATKVALKNLSDEDKEKLKFPFSP